MGLISLELVDLTCGILGFSAVFIRQGKLLRLGGFGGLLYLGFLLIPLPFIHLLGDMGCHGDRSKGAELEGKHKNGR